MQVPGVFACSNLTFMPLADSSRAVVEKLRAYVTTQLALSTALTNWPAAALVLDREIDLPKWRYDLRSFRISAAMYDDCRFSLHGHLEAYSGMTDPYLHYRRTCRLDSICTQRTIVLLMDLSSVLGQHCMLAASWLTPHVRVLWAR
eukprot:COSAG05_NODE_603_length_8402_cov_7.090931_1_plen_146_part_00